MGSSTDTRERMIGAAQELFRRQGYDRSGFSQILQLSGAARGAIYHHFPGGKEELAVAVIRRSHSEIGDRVRESIETGAPSTALHAYIAETIDNLVDSSYAAGCPLAPMVLEATDWSDSIRDATREAFASWAELLEDALAAQGTSTARARSLAALVIAAVEGGIILARTHRDPTPLRQIAAELGALLDDAVGA